MYLCPWAPLGHSFRPKPFYVISKMAGSFPTAAITKSHKPCDLSNRKQQKLILSAF